MHENNYKEYEHTTIENVHFNAFRDSTLGTPVRGDRDNVGNLTSDDLHRFRENNWTGENIVVVGTGNVNHQELVDLVEQHFGSINRSSNFDRSTIGAAPFTPALLFARDDEMVNANVGVFYDAPTFSHRDYWAFQLLTRVFGEYEI